MFTLPVVQEYVPAPYLLSTSILTAPQLISQFQDFCGSISYASSAPALVFERLVGNLNGIFTVALERERQQHVTALKESHDENKQLRLSNEKLKQEIVGLKATKHSAEPLSENSNSVVKQKNPIVGKFSTAEVRSWQELRRETSRVVNFARPYHLPPGLPLGLRMVDIGKTQNVRVRSYATDIKKDHFKIHVDTWENTELHGAACAWLEVEANDPDFQFGTFNTFDDHPWTKPQTLTTRLITFHRRYSAPPKVVVWLTAFDMKRENGWRIKTYATNITATSFTIHIDTWADSVLYSAAASWIAYPADKSNISSGSCNTMDVRRCDSPQHQNSAYVKFGNNTFSKPPRTVLAINYIDISNKKNLRLEVKTSAVTAAGMTWHMNSWADTILYSAGASYIALA